MILSHQTHRAVERSPMCNALVKIFSPSWSSDSHTCLAVLYFSPSLLALSLPLTYFSICKYLSSIISLTRDLTVARCHCCPCNGIQGPSGQRSAHLCKNAGLLEASLTGLHVCNIYREYSNCASLANIDKVCKNSRLTRTTVWAMVHADTCTNYSGPRMILMLEFALGKWCMFAMAHAIMATGACHLHDEHGHVEFILDK